MNRRLVLLRMGRQLWGRVVVSLMVPSASSDATTTTPPAKWYSQPYGRLAIGGVLLLVEYLAVSFAFDAQSVAARGGIWSVLGMAGNIGPLLVVGATAFLMLPQLRGVLASTATRLKRANAWLLLLHLLFAAAFATVTALAFGGADAPRGPALLWMLAWSVLGTGTAASLLIGVLGDWKWLVRTAGRVAVAGGALGLAAWLGGTASTELWSPLSNATFHAASAVLGLLGFEPGVDVANVILELEGFAISVDPVCSGFEGIGLFVVLMAGFMYQQRARLRFPLAYLVLPLGTGVIWFGNVARIVSLMIVGARVDPGIALGSFHSKAGWVFFSGITLGVAVLTRRSSLFARRETAEAEEHSDNPAVPLLLPVLVWIGVGLATSMFSDRHDPLYGVRVFATGVVLWTYRGQYRPWLKRPTAAAWILGAIVGVAWLAIPYGLPPKGGSDVAPGGNGAPLWFTTWVVLRCLGTVVVVPLCEELAFRGYLMRRLTRRDFWDLPLTAVSWMGLLGSSLVFGAVHGRWVLGILTGVLYALLVRRSGRLSDGIVAHAVSNAVIAAWVLTTGDWRHW